MKKDEKITGLTSAEVRKRRADGLVNTFSQKASNTTWDVIKRNVFTTFNLLNFAIAIALVAVGAWSNLVFVAVISFNIITGVITELRAKKMIEKLNLMSKTKAYLL